MIDGNFGNVSTGVLFSKAITWKAGRVAWALDCEQSLSFPSVFLAFLRASVELWSSEQRGLGGRGFFPVSPHSLLVSFPNLHNFDEFCALRISGTKTDYS